MIFEKIFQDLDIRIRKNLIFEKIFQDLDIRIMCFCLNKPYIRAQDLKIGGFGTEFRCGAIGAGLVTQKLQKYSEIADNAKYRKIQNMQNHVFWPE